MSNGDSITALPEVWRERATLLKRWAVPDSAANFWAHAAEELESVLAHHADEELTLQNAASESGYSRDHLGRMVRIGQIPNAGRKNAPRIRRGDLPRRTGTQTDHRTPELVPADRASVVSAVLQRPSAVNHG